MSRVRPKRRTPIVPEIEREKRLGHADIAMTMNLYSHVTADMQRQAADAIEALISGANERTA